MEKHQTNHHIGCDTCNSLGSLRSVIRFVCFSLLLWLSLVRSTYRKIHIQSKDSPWHRLAHFMHIYVSIKSNTIHPHCNVQMCLADLSDRCWIDRHTASAMIKEPVDCEICIDFHFCLHWIVNVWLNSEENHISSVSECREKTKR